MSDLFQFKPSIPDSVEAEIQTRLNTIESEHDIHFLFAIESGSRAWGFPSPDSDFDVRFVYAHDVEWYLTLEPGRDVIETPLEGDWDINGWDIRKALNLLLKPNPVLLEWMFSPIRYRWNPTVCKMLVEFAAVTIRPEECIYHYYHLAKRQWERTIETGTKVNLKKYFYALRPILAIRWVRLNPHRLPPMNFQELMAETQVPEHVQLETAQLLETKALSSEMGMGSRLDGIDSLILEELKWVEENGGKKRSNNATIRASANQLFRDIIELISQ